MTRGLTIAQQRELKISGRSLARTLIPDSEGFEDGVVDGWTDINSGSIAVTTSNVYEGTYAGVLDGSQEYNSGAYWDPTVNNLYDGLNTLVGYIYEDQGDSIVGLSFFNTLSGNNYYAHVATEFDNFILGKVVSGSQSDLDGGSNISESTGQFFKITLTYNTSTNDLTAELVRESDGTILASLSATDTDISPNAAGVVAYRNNPTVDNVSVN